MRSTRVHVITEVGLAIALCAALQYLGIRLPINIAGGSISLAMLPIMIVALRRGVFAGVVAGALFGLIDVALEPYVVHPAQFVLDYPVAFGAVGLTGLGSRSVVRLFSEGLGGRAAVAAVVWSLVGSAGRFAAAFVSGIVFFAANAPAGQPVWLYSAVYNLSYLLPSALACAVAVFVLVPVLQRAVPVAPGSRDRD